MEHESRLRTRLQNCLIKIEANRKGMSPISALKILLLVNSFMQISVDVYNEPFAIKCCAMYNPNESSDVYLLTSDDKYVVCGMDFLPNQPLC